ncbi:MAG: DeoR/GlpR family DNA-binding transcription regulator [Bacilli bacterium]|nr:DeoR/GlpR family DNA-binding transcription regulator [Bacilli bacterium]
MADVANLFVLERYHSISDYLKEHGRATVEELASILYVSPATIRRDLAAMQKLGMIKRTHGGAIHVEASEEVSIFMRMESDGEEKEQTAALALNHIPEFNSIFIDNSSTALALAERMDFTYKTVITNGLQLAQKLSGRKNIELFLLGGSLHSSSGSTNGGFALSQLHSFRFDLMLSGAAAIDKNGAYEKSLSTQEIKKAAFAHSEKRMLLVGESKFSLKSTFRVAELDEYDIICTNAKSELIKEYKDAGFRIFNK